MLLFRLDGRQEAAASLTEPSAGQTDKPLTSPGGATPVSYATNVARGGSEDTTPPPISAAMPAPGKPRDNNYAKALKGKDADYVFSPEEIIQEELTYYSCHGGKRMCKYW